MYYLGDLKESALPHPKTTRLSGNVGLQYQLTNRFSTKLNYHIGSLKGDDQYASATWRKNRNLNYKTGIHEISLRLVADILPQHTYKGLPYIYGGIGYFNFNPKSDGVALQPLGTEGQFIPGGNYPATYKLWQINAPVGIGFRYRLSRRWGLTTEITYHITFTDYLDDVSADYPDLALLAATPNGATSVAYSDRRLDNTNYARGNNKRNDGWIDVSFMLIYYIGNQGKDNSKMLENCKELYKNMNEQPK